MPRTRRSPADDDPRPRPISAQPRWSLVLRALREASGASQEGWAAQLGFGRSTIQRWENGDLPPGPDAEAALLRVATARSLFRTYYQGPLRVQTPSPELIRDLLAEARLDGLRERPTRQRSNQSTVVAPPQTRVSPPRTSFVGRERDLAQVGALVERHRLVSLTGPGGAGKTRLALQLANEHDWGSTWFVDLSAIAEANLVPLALATALGLRDDADESALDAALHMLAPLGGLLLGLVE